MSRYRLFIAEKPSLARAIAEALPGPHRRSKDHIECGGGNVVAWCAGHILETAPPDAYNPDYKRWSLQALPIVPKEWLLRVTIPALMKSIKSLLKNASSVVHAGDPDREGQLLVDEVLHFLAYKGPVERVLISDLSPAAVQRALGALEPNAKYRSLYESALARQRADWLYGMNMTRLYTLLGRASGYDGVLSVGRVQTPLLGLIVQRDIAIESFKPATFFVVSADVTSDGGAFKATWTPGAAALAHLDEEGRLRARNIADALCARVAEQQGHVTKSSRENKSEAPPLPYSLADLQIDAGRRLGLSAQAVLDACQSLYETHRLLTYPRSDCSYLPEGHLGQVREVVAAIAHHAPSLTVAAAKADLSLRSKAWNDKKITAHHAIVPTPNATSRPQLSANERAVYEFVCTRYLAQFYPPFEYALTKLEIDACGEIFVASGRQITRSGWKSLREENHTDDEPNDQSVPSLIVGATVRITKATTEEKRTQPPKPFNDATLIQAMCNIARFVSDPTVKKILSEADGIGTPATRAAIIETLFARGFVVRQKKNVVSTPTGRALIASLPTTATTPEMTAVWEAAIRAIQEGRTPLDAFLERVTVQLQQLVTQGRQTRLNIPSAAAGAPAGAALRRTAR